MVDSLTAGIQTSQHQLDEILKRVERLEEEQKQRESQGQELFVAHKSVSVSKLDEYNPRQEVILSP